jgi:hypothetical protein
MECFLFLSSRLMTSVEMIWLFGIAWSPEVDLLLNCNTLKNKTVAVGVVLICQRLFFDGLCPLFQLTFSLLLKARLGAIDVSLFFSIELSLLWPGYSQMIFLEHFFNSSRENLDPVGTFYIPDRRHALTVWDSKITISKPSMGSVYFASFCSSKLKRSVWTKVASVWALSILVNPSKSFIVFDFHFANLFAHFLFYGGFVKTGINSFDRYADILDFDAVTLDVLKSRALSFVSVQFKDPPLLDSVLAFDNFVPLSPPLNVDAKLFLGIKWRIEFCSFRDRFPIDPSKNGMLP